MRFTSILKILAVALFCSYCLTCGGPGSSKLVFELSFPDSVHEGPVTGRAFVFISDRKEPEPRLQRIGWGSVQPVFGMDVDQLTSDKVVRIDSATPGFPVHSLEDIPPGDYYVQGFLNKYTEFHRSDGHVIWAHMDQWEGQNFPRSPGNIYSETQKVHLDPRAGKTIQLHLDRIIPPIEVPPDTRWVKRIKFESKLLSEFWGRPMPIGATILLPKGYDDHPNVYYPVLYLQNHFSSSAPFEFTTKDNQSDQARLAHALRNQETGYEFYRAWSSDNFPRMIVVTFQHPTPYFDDSHAVNSANNGPYGDAIMNELIPLIEERFRIIRESYARVLTGGSTGGWMALALQVYHPEFFGGTWPLYPDSIDFRRLVLTNLYEDENAFVAQDHEIAPRDHRLPGQQWRATEQPFRRSVEGQVMVSMREFNRLENVIASNNRSGLQLHPWWSVYCPVGQDGYPRSAWDPETGVIDREVAHYMRDKGYDLSHYIQTNWPTIGPDLVGKLHIAVGNMDNYYLNVAVYLLEDFLEGTTDPYYAGSFTYGRPKQGHFWQPWNHAELMRTMAGHINNNAPPGGDTSVWNY